MRPCLEWKGHEDVAVWHMMLESDAPVRRQRRVLAMKISHETALPIAGNPISQNVIVDSPANIDPINICGRIHDHILRNRIAGYREGGLMRYLHGENSPLPADRRVAFEHHMPDSNVLVAFPLEAWPHLLAAMKRRTCHHGAWSGKLTAREKELAERILGEMAERGPLSSDQIDDERRSRQTIWGSFSLAKAT